MIGYIAIAISVFALVFALVVFLKARARSKRIVAAYMNRFTPLERQAMNSLQTRPRPMMQGIIRPRPREPETAAEEWPAPDNGGGYSRFTGDD